ncbi:sulfotransferase family protein [Aspergillus tanneri]|uniref:Uncharacterized protein n=1 Tax=Aspergillus tanneri TaxID=1220188 RepID=A0A5M9MAL9_9EURO|nr:uncharacterized protein ATNIH1004_009468 [Aspergillus tanneri]KAA8642716.1 hypothetical protein ATNIH1004_009468 [Aspergillus tanneri]
MEPPAHREKEMKVLALGMSRTGTMSLYVALKELGYSCYHMAECSLDQKNDSLALWSRAIDAKFNENGRKFSGADFDQMLWRYNDASHLPNGFAAHYDQVRVAAQKRGREVLEFEVQDGWGPLCQFLRKEAPDKPFPHVNEEPEADTLEKPQPGAKLSNKSRARDRNKRIRRNTLDGKNDDDVMATGNQSNKELTHKHTPLAGIKQTNNIKPVTCRRSAPQPPPNKDDNNELSRDMPEYTASSSSYS